MDYTISDQELEKLRKTCKLRLTISIILTVVAYLAILCFAVWAFYLGDPEMGARLDAPLSEKIVTVVGVPIVLAVLAWGFFYWLIVKPGYDHFNSLFKNKYVVSTIQETGFFQNGELGTGSAQGGNNVQGNGAQNTAGTQGMNGGQNPAASFMGLQLLGAGQAGIQIEAEDTAFTTKGTVRTSDGREISFNVNVGMSRRFQQYYQEEFQQASVDLCDPLVINLDTDVAELSDQTFYFDIDGDGELDEISQLGAGSGYLALDKNGDGIINDGNELFGTSSGNGFADLAKYDEDGNGWIDENDAIWDKLKIWCKDENGNDVLYRLADKGVGAICLQNVATDFALKGQEGQTKGAIRNTGVFLYENGNVGTVQHVDVAKYDKGA